MSWLGALWRGALIVVYFVVTTVWLPDFVLRLSAVQDSSQSLRDIIVLLVWGGALGAGIYGLRRAQSAGLFR